MDLSELGLTQNETKAYETLLHKGKSTAAELSKDSGVVYGRIYDVLASLESKGLIKIIPEKTKKFVPSDPSGTDGKIWTLPKELMGQDPCGRWSRCGRYIAYVKISHSGSWKVHSPIYIVRIADSSVIAISPPGWVGHHWDYDWLPPETES